MKFIAQAGALLALLSSLVASAQAPRLPIGAFFSPPMFEQAVLSPDQSRVAVLVNRPGERTKLALARLDDDSPTDVVAAVDRLDIASVHWLSPTRLVFQAGQRHERRDTPISVGLWVLDVPSGEVKQLISTRFNINPGQAQTGSRVKEAVDKLLPWTWRLLRALDDGSEDVIVQRYTWDEGGEFSHEVLGRLSTRTGKVTLITENVPHRVAQWLVDRKGQPQACITQEGASYGVHLFDEDTKRWKLWRSGRRGIDIMPAPLARLPGGDLVVADHDAAESGGDIRIVQRQSATGEKRQTLLSIPGYDWNGELVLDREGSRLLGLRYEADAADTAWFDRGMKALQAEVDKLLPVTVNHLSCSDCLTDKRVLVRALSDRQPVIIYVYDRESRNLKTLFRSRPGLNAADMASREVLRLKTRDGLDMPVQLTKPLGPPGARPAVVLVHGGPWVRGNHWYWDEMAQFLANRGYLVIEPEFRGSAGYGRRHENLGRRQWGQAMQADLADAAKWAVDKGLADGKRICIAGASYGGYATLMGLARNPELFRCGFEWVGVTDPASMFLRSRTDIESMWAENDLKLLIGDPREDAEMLAANAPVKLAAQIKQPLLMAYGAEDRRVEIQQGLDMKKALEVAGYQGLEWVVYANESHGWRSLETNVDFWGRVERFLERHIGGAAPKP
ncbi:alpha/beta fold hydrolase [Roseateles sp.]|uniref:alpha/beta hydrolase family protein n=1 Tax=Roseateles sp. TaxID=1971397 RepID=UPI0025E577E8|nr:alpha/beta fold hydrolase [Roseateles sp.]MBV8035172.1 S9 family peptidase [Roseateles sp.]